MKFPHTCRRGSSFRTSAGYLSTMKSDETPSSVWSALPQMQQLLMCTRKTGLTCRTHKMPWEGLANTRHARVRYWGASPVWKVGNKKKKILSRNKYIKYPLVHGCRTQRYHTVQQLFPGPNLVEALKSPFYISCQRSSLSTEFCTFNIQIFPSPQIT